MHTLKGGVRRQMRVKSSNGESESSDDDDAYSPPDEDDDDDRGRVGAANVGQPLDEAVQYYYTEEDLDEPTVERNNLLAHSSASTTENNNNNINNNTSTTSDEEEVETKYERKEFADKRQQQVRSGGGGSGGEARVDEKDAEKAISLRPSPEAGLSLSERIDASETLEEFEAQEREVARQLGGELVPASVQNCQLLGEEIRLNSFAESEESEGGGFTLGRTSKEPQPPPPSGSASSKMRSSAIPQENAEYYEVPSPSDFRLSDAMALMSDKSDGLRDGAGAGGVAKPSGVSSVRAGGPASPSIHSAIGSSFAFAGGMAAAVAGNTSFVSDVTPSIGETTVYGSDLPSNPPNNQFHRPTSGGRSKPGSATTLDATGIDVVKFVITDDMREILELVNAYEAPEIEIEPVLKPFPLDYIPTVGDVNPFIKVPRPDKAEDLLGLSVLDEPSATQSDSALVDLRLHHMSKSVAAMEAPVKAVGRVDKNQHQIEQWIECTRELRKQKPPDRMVYAGGPMPDVEQLMQEWPPEVEQTFSNAVLPNAKLSLSLEEYADLCLALADIPVHPGRRIQSLHLLFSLYLEFKNSQHFRNLAAQSSAFDTTPNPSRNNNIIINISNNNNGANSGGNNNRLVL